LYSVTIGTQSHHRVPIIRFFNSEVIQMNLLTSHIVKTLGRHSIGLSLFATLALLTLLGLGASTGKPLLPGLGSGKRAALEAVTFTGTLSQTKIVQNGNRTVYLDVVVEVPSVQSTAIATGSTDIVVVLDRSGSMATANKLPYAKAALRDIVSRLGPGDRFALVSFANHTIVHSPLVAVTFDQKEALNRLIDSIRAVGGTNLSDGLSHATALIADTAVDRRHKVMLLSDGEANQGITDPGRLAQMARDLTAKGAVLSTIGMGLGFNETLMASLADHGMGSYAYLENLNGLNRILAADLHESRQLYAASSRLEIRLGDGVRLLDAGGYPIERRGSATATVVTGQLLAGSRKRFIMTFEVPNDTATDVSLGNVMLVYDRQKHHHRIAMAEQSLTLAVVAPDRREETVRSIDASAYKASWLKNNLGRMQNNLSQWLREGKKEKAERALANYRDSVKTADAAAPIPLVSKELEADLDAMEETVEEAFRGSREEQRVKRNRAAKSLQYRSRQKQRSTQ
jgi:Ca-activated chloride channel homolog